MVVARCDVGGCGQIGGWGALPCIVRSPARYPPCRKQRDVVIPSACDTYRLSETPRNIALSVSVPAPADDGSIDLHGSGVVETGSYRYHATKSCWYCPLSIAIEAEADDRSI